MNVAAEARTAPDERGSLTISEHVLERLAAHAAGEIDRVGGSAGRTLGISLGGEALDRSAKTSARIAGGEVELDVRISLEYPAPVGATTERVRGHLRERVEDLTGMPVRRVGITVTALHVEPAGRRRIE
ncbi:Asp23/Gls24 family envelope stress response protein [Amycolatopsis orientalis]|uniref:Asp23/Gls24 family envelope stress response protein n=1 Tax=Amycolatopsis orientalis TaxID=31958 RepID=UPI00039EA44B|nr:Asp23/Gls24 family envelope stress response protein [Amycolatopsis orientalis]